MASVPHQLDPAHHSPSRQHAHHQSDDEQRYQVKYRELKKQVKEVENENERLLFQVMQTKHNIQRLRLERSILYEKLGTLDPNAAQPAPRQQQPMIASGSSRREPVAHYQQVPSSHHHHAHAPPPPPPHHASQHHYASPVPPYPTSSSSRHGHHHHSSRHHGHHAHHAPPQQYAPPPPPPPPPQGYAPEPPVDARAGSPAGHARSPVYLPSHGMHHPDEREPGPHLVPIQSVRDAYPESGARGEYDPRDRDRDYDRQQQQQPEGEWRRRQSMQPSPPRDLPSVAAVLGDRKRKRSEDMEGDSEPPAPMHAD